MSLSTALSKSLNPWFANLLGVPRYAKAYLESSTAVSSCPRGVDGGLGDRRP
jgi:hypothetical protein